MKEQLSEVEKINPYSQEGEKGEQVERMFDSIAPAYDFMNMAMTFGLHRRWRNIALKNAYKRWKKYNGETPEFIGGGTKPKKILDIATGTGDVAFKLAKMFPQSQIIGVDLSEGMLNIARKKLAKKSDETSRISFLKADCLHLPFNDEEFDMITVAYGVRNFSQLSAGLKEMFRVLKKNGVLCINFCAQFGSIILNSKKNRAKILNYSKKQFSHI